jgi:hypothetical protein
MPLAAGGGDEAQRRPHLQRVPRGSRRALPGGAAPLGAAPRGGHGRSARERPTPRLWGLAAVVAWLAHGLQPAGTVAVHGAAWDPQAHATWAEGWAVGRHQLWGEVRCAAAAPAPELGGLPRATCSRRVHAGCYAP